MNNITTRERTYLIHRQREVQDQSLFRYDVKNQTIGELKAYIEELEYELKTLKNN